MPSKNAISKNKAKSHVFATKSTRKGNGSKANVNQTSHSPPTGIDGQPSGKPPYKKARTGTFDQPKKKKGLLDLPPEIRLMIYHHVVEKHDMHNFVRVFRGKLEKRGPNARIKPKRGRNKARFFIKCCDHKSFETTYVARNACCIVHQGTEWSLMWVCSIIRKEVIPFMFETRCVQTSSLDALIHFLKDLTPDQRNSIRRLNVCNAYDESISLRTLNKWSEIFAYLAGNLQLKWLRIEATSNLTNFENDLVWHGDEPSLSWLDELCKMRNLEDVEVDIKGYEPEIGRERWAEIMEDNSEISAEETFEYDPWYDWMLAEDLSRDVSWHVAEKVLSKQAWEQRKKVRPFEWNMVLDVREDMREIMDISGCSCGDCLIDESEETEEP